MMLYRRGTALRAVPLQRRHAVVYRQVATDSIMAVQLQENVLSIDLLDNVCILDLL